MLKTTFKRQYRQIALLFVHKLIKTVKNVLSN